MIPMILLGTFAASVSYFRWLFRELTSGRDDGRFCRACEAIIVGPPLLDAYALLDGDVCERCADRRAAR
jgi:hypothetical protein